MKNISVIGLGKLGTPFAITLASRGFSVIGIDIDSKSVLSLKTGKFGIYEPLINNLWSKNKSLIKATIDYKEAIQDSEITFIIVPTPSQKNGSFSNFYVKKALEKIGKILKDKDKFHLISLVSTVVPTSSELEFIPLLEKQSGKKVGRDFGFCYNPAFIALGSVVKNLLEPDFVLIGESDKKSGDVLEKFYQRFCINNPPIMRMNLVNAEIAKLSLNTFITTKISYANMIGHLCEVIPDADANIVLKAIGQDRRVGSLYLKAASCYGGPCFPRDNKALISVGKKFGISLPIAKATDKINDRHSQNIFKRIKKLVTKKDKITILGMSYKPDTDVIEKSQGTILVDLLINEGYQVTVYDPKALRNVKKLFGKKIRYSQNLENSLKSSTIMVIATNWKEFEKINNKQIKLMKKNPIIFDCWGLLEGKDLGRARYLRNGKYEKI
ncbi:MAG: nucleotide sugar dehydrogenase [Candidatus Omnitrophica bacterium]|nr:nucleotide sugar dehydrogenase [Candidatus Omnitrophota bacterium]